MASPISSLPLFYQMAYFLGFKVEVFIDEKWQDASFWIASHDTPIRISSTSDKISQLKSIVSQFFNEVEISYSNSTHTLLVPKDMPPNSILLAYIGFGTFFKLNENLQLEELDFNSYFPKYKNREISVYYSYPKNSFFGIHKN